MITDAIARDFDVRMPFIRQDGVVTQEIIDSTQPIEPKAASSDDIATFVAVGSLDDANGFLVIADAMDHLDRKDVRLVIAGDGPLRREVEALASRDPRVKYVGYVSTESVCELYRCATAILSARLTIGVRTPYCFPSKVLEAIASGVPVITTAPGHLKEEYGAYMTIIEGETGEAVADAMTRALSEDRAHLRDRALAGRRYIVRRKNTSAVGRQLVDYCLDLIGLDQEGPGTR